MLEPQSLQRDAKAQRRARADPRSHSKSGTKVRGKELGTVLGPICPHRVVEKVEREGPAEAGDSQGSAVCVGTTRGLSPDPCGAGAGLSPTVLSH